MKLVSRNADDRLRVRRRHGDHNDCFVQIDGVEGVSWCGAVSIIITEQRMFAVAE